MQLATPSARGRSARHMQPLFLKFLILFFFVPIVISNFQMARAGNFFEFEIFDVRSESASQKA